MYGNFLEITNLLPQNGITFVIVVSISPNTVFPNTVAPNCKNRMPIIDKTLVPMVMLG